MRSILPPLAALAAALALVTGASAQTPLAVRGSETRPLASGPSATHVAVFDGLWCGTGLLHEFSLRLTQQQQDVQGTLVRRDRVREIGGHVEGETLRTQNTKVGSLVLERAGDELRITGGEGPLALARGATFQRAASAACAG
jgi:hypothetical protein